MASVFKRGGKGNRGGKWYAAWIDESGKPKVKSAKTTDKAAAQLFADKRETEALKRREGFVSVSDDRYVAEGRKPIDAHLTDFGKTLSAEGNDGEYVTQAEARARKVAVLCNAKTIADLTAFNVQQAIASMKAKGKSLATCNSYIRSIKGFTSWLCRDKRLGDNPLKSVKQFNEATDRRLLRRELTPDELVRLIETTERRTRKEHKFSGPDRAMLYRVAVGTGFRAGELRSLVPESFKLDNDPPTITIQATHSKRRRTDVQPIHDDLVAHLRPWLADKPAGKRVFARMPGETARMLRADLKAARAEWIDAAPSKAEKVRREKSEFLVYRNAAGEVFDFHAFRHTYISTLVSGGASVKVAQELARHSTPVLTIGRYAHTRLHDLRGALNTFGNAKTQSPDGRSAEKAQRICRDTPLSVATDCEQPVADSELILSKKVHHEVLIQQQDTSPCETVRRGATEAEGTGLEPATPCGAPHFQCGR